MRVIVTRPTHEAALWVQGLRAAGHDALSLPLIDIAPPADGAAVQAAWSRWGAWHAAMFVSAQAVRLFFAQRPASMDHPGAMPRCWATGLGTQRALLQAGVPAAQIDCPPETSAQFDSETLWQHVRDQVRADQSVLIVRGSDGQDESASGQGRDWLGQQLQAQGVQVQWVAAYARRMPQWSEAQQQSARTATQDGSVWLFSSSQALNHLAELMPGAKWAKACALTTHPRIAQAAQALGFGRVMQVRPVLADVVASLECLA